ncbi:MAG: orotidine 5'-phosphate decarboxylase [Halobacteriales archaeon]|nr:orotidine 5'-phosphate decarboxylase [Halobacteriales archaeon]
MTAGTVPPPPGSGPTVKLQLALDLLNLHRALDIAREAVEGGADWVEAGTPLIKSEGLEAVRQLKRAFPGHVIVADMKVMDTGGFETEMAAKAGAGVVTILGASDDGTIREAVKAGQQYGCKVMVDLIGVHDKPRRAAEAEKLGAHLIGLHVGIDEQMRGLSPVQLVRDVAKATRLPIAVAGGVTSETAAALVEAGAEVIIVGGAITKAKSPLQATKDIVQAVRTRQPVRSEGMKKFGPEQLREAFGVASTPNISDAMHRQGAMHGITPIMPGLKMIGRAVTARTVNGDWAKPVQLIDLAQPGDVLVIDVDGGQDAVWGELATNSCVMKGVAGVVIDGAIRDVDAIRALRFPAFARHFVPNAGDPKGFGETNVEVRCGGQRVRPGDWVIGDDSGVVVVPEEEAQEIANRSVEVKEQEDRLREEIQQGSTLSERLKLKQWEKVIG